MEQLKPAGKLPEQVLKSESTRLFGEIKDRLLVMSEVRDAIVDNQVNLGAHRAEKNRNRIPFQIEGTHYSIHLVDLFGEETHQ